MAAPGPLHRHDCGWEFPAEEMFLGAQLPSTERIQIVVAIPEQKQRFSGLSLVQSTAEEDQLHQGEKRKWRRSLI